MYVLNAAKSSEYFDSLVDELDDSAVNVIHAAWVEHTAPNGRLEHLEPVSPPDMWILYQAAVATFRGWERGTTSREELSGGGRIIHRERAERRLQAVADAETVALATRF